MSKTFQQAAEKAIADIVKMAEEKGEPEQIDLIIYQNESSLRKAGVMELSLQEHTAYVKYIAERLKDLDFTVAVHLSHTED